MMNSSGSGLPAEVHDRFAATADTGLAPAQLAAVRHMMSWMPRQISHQFTGYVAAKPISMPICIMNQKRGAVGGQVSGGEHAPDGAQHRTVDVAPPRARNTVGAPAVCRRTSLETWALVKHLGRGAGYRRQELALAP
jgi:hypothetical protein